MRRTLTFTALALTALALASCQTYSTPVEPPPLYVVPMGLAAPTAKPLSSTASAANPYGSGAASSYGTYGGTPVSSPDPLDVRRIVLEKKAKLLTLEAQKLALEKSMRDLRTEIAAEEKKLPKKKSATKAKLSSVTQQHSVSKAPKADYETALARKLEAILQRLDRLEKAPAAPRSPSVPVP